MSAVVRPAGWFNGQDTAEAARQFCLADGTTWQHAECCTAPSKNGNALWMVKFVAAKYNGVHPELDGKM
eukprot:6323824-Prymnesium_polylepis.1